MGTSKTEPTGCIFPGMERTAEDLVREAMRMVAWADAGPLAPLDLARVAATRRALGVGRVAREAPPPALMLALMEAAEALVARGELVRQEDGRVLPADARLRRSRAVGFTVLGRRE